MNSEFIRDAIKRKSILLILKDFESVRIYVKFIQFHDIELKIWSKYNQTEVIFTNPPNFLKASKIDIKLIQFDDIAFTAQP